MVDAGFELRDGFLQRGAERVIRGLGAHVRPRRYEMRGDAEGRTGFQAALDEHAGLVDAQRVAQRFDVLADERGEELGRLMVAVLQDEFHNAPILTRGRGFDKYALSNQPFVLMQSKDLTADWLNYHHLRYFHAIAREGSVRRAAEKLRTSQSSICAQVKQFEAALGETLYRRSGRSIVLTDFGRLIHGYAEEIFTLGRELLSLSKRAPSARTLRLHIGIVDSFPKLLSLDILRPVFAHEPPVRSRPAHGSCPRPR